MASAAPPPASDDALVATARDYFESFLLNYTTDSDTVEPSSGADEPALPYVEQVRKNKRKRERSRERPHTKTSLKQPLSLSLTAASESASSVAPCLSLSLSPPRSRSRSCAVQHDA